MQSASRSTAPRNRHACEPCRQKKTKCPAERPACSLCQYTNKRCSYLPRDGPRIETHISKTPYPKTAEQRFRQLESQISKISKHLNLSSDYVDAIRGHSPDHSYSPIGASPSNTIIGRLGDSPCGLDRSSTSFDFELELPHEVWEHLIDIYRRKVHLQPLPLFNLETLQSRSSSFPTFLRRSLLALIFTISTHPYYSGKESDFADFCSGIAKETVTKMAAKGNTSLEVIQSLCVLALREILICKSAQAWMTIGTASHLQMLRSQASRSNRAREASLTDAGVRCYWSVVILERAFTCQPA